jgi:predicted branched-subunit amino acid permease
VPDPEAFGVDAAFPAGLLALLLPVLRTSQARRVGLAAAALALAATPFLPPGLPVLLGLLGLVAAGRPDPGEASGGDEGEGGGTGQNPP